MYVTEQAAFAFAVTEATTMWGHGLNFWYWYRWQQQQLVVGTEVNCREGYSFGASCFAFPFGQPGG